MFKVVGDAFRRLLHRPKGSECGSARSAGWHRPGMNWVVKGTDEAAHWREELDPESDEYLISHTKNRVARIMSAGHGGQILISGTVMELLGERLSQEFFLKDMGEHYLKGLLHPEHLFQVILPELPADFPPLNRRPAFNLPFTFEPGRRTGEYHQAAGRTRMPFNHSDWDRWKRKNPSGD
jgi:hypothetical protein